MTDNIDWWLKAFEDEDLEMFEYVTEDNDDPIDEQNDTMWIMKLVEIDEDDNEKVIRSLAIWDSDLRGVREGEDLMLLLLVVGWIFEITFIFQMFADVSLLGVAFYWGLIMTVATAIIAKKW